MGRVRKRYDVPCQREPTCRRDPFVVGVIRVSQAVKASHCVSIGDLRVGMPVAVRLLLRLQGNLAGKSCRTVRARREPVSTIAENHRTARRFDAPSERARAIVIVDGEEHDAVVSDVSASGFGLLLFRGLHVPVGSVLRLVADDSVHDCEVIHTRPEESFQYVGVRRLTDAAMTEVSLFSSGTLLSRNGSFACPFTIISFVICLGLGAVAVSLYLDVNPFEAWMTNADDAETTAALTSEERARAFEYRREQARLRREAALRERANRGATEPGILDFFTRESRAAKALAGNRDLDWGDLTIELGLTESQEKSMVEMLADRPEGAQRSTAAAKSRALKLLTTEQRTRYRNLLEASN